MTFLLLWLGPWALIAGALLAREINRCRFEPCDMMAFAPSPPPMPQDRG